MKIPKTIFVLIGLLAALAVLAGTTLDLLWLRLLCKPLIMLSLIAWIWPPRRRYGAWVIVGLFFSILGGELLELEGMFLFGLIGFLLAHLAYIAAYLSDSRRLALGWAIPFFAYGLGVYFFLWPGLGRLALPVAVYVLAICTMMWRAAARIGTQGEATRGEWAALIGAILFAFSDTLIGATVFRTPLVTLAYPILLLYWAGQAGIAYSTRTSHL